MGTAAFVISRRSGGVTDFPAFASFRMGAFRPRTLICVMLPLSALQRFSATSLLSIAGSSSVFGEKKKIRFFQVI
jgi:hypothetical protein